MTAPSLAARLVTRAPAYRVNPYRRTRVPARAQLHLMNRLGTGYTRDTWRQMRRAGGAGRWFNQQLHPQRIRESAQALAVEEWFPQRDHGPATRWANHGAGRYQAWEYARDLGAYTMLKRMYSNRPVLETMVDFWSDHFHVKATGDLAWIFRDDYDKTIRKHALGRFDTLLEAVTLHPAMVIFLDNHLSVRDAPNENHGRELLELHTVGRTSGYSEAMVKDSAKILSGYTVDVRSSWRASYDPDRHTTGAVQVLGFKAPNSRADGRETTAAYLRYLAHHPATARTIARKLATRFVSDTPSAALVEHLATVFLRSGTDIKATLRALVAHREFTASVGSKVRAPIDDMVHTARVLGVRARAPRSERSFAIAIAYAHGGDQMFSWPRPDGAPLHNAAWSSASRMLASFQMHWALAGGWWPKEAVRYRSSRSWLPQRRIRFDQYVDHLCRVLHGRGSTPVLLKAACQATDVRPAEVVTRDHPVANWLFVRLLVTLLDSPVHMTR
jgi:uncharacterized protein (DUF1800 family)